MRWKNRKRMRRHAARAAALTAILAVGAPQAASAEPWRHGIAMHGAPKYAAGFTHFPYANATAPKGGRLVLGALGSFDSVHPFLVRGKRARGLALTYQGLLRALAASDPPPRATPSASSALSASR